MSSSDKTTVTWQDVAIRVPRPGFFLGDDNAACPMQSDTVLLSNETLPPSWDLGQLGRLPLELLHQITEDVGATDAHALVALRNINRATAAVVDAMRDFATVAAFPRAMRALMLLAPTVALSDLAACLQSTECASCRRQHEQQAIEAPSATSSSTSSSSHNFSAGIPHGDYIYLLGPERICYACFRSCPEYLPVIQPASLAPTSNPRIQHTQTTQDEMEMPRRLRVPPARYGVLAAISQPIELLDRRTMAMDDSDDLTLEPVRYRDPTAPCGVRVEKPGRHASTGQLDVPSPIRYAAVIPAPYWPESDGESKDGEHKLERGYGCLACIHTNRSNDFRGWANPLARYTRSGLQRHVEDPRLGGRVVSWRDENTGIRYYEHAVPRHTRYAPPPEFGSMVDMARRYRKVVEVYAPVKMELKR